MTVSATLAINDEVHRRQAAGLPTVPLGFGEAGLPVHPLLVEALRDAAGRNGYGPVAGIPALREAAAGYWSRRGLPTDPSLVVAGPGSKPLLWAVLGARGGAVALTQPSWVSYAAQAALQGLAVHRVPGRGLPDPDLLDALARRTSLSTVVVTLPDNPTGTLADPAAVTALCEVAERHDLLIISDEIYRDLVHSPTPFVSPAELVPHRTVVTTGLSKNLAVGGWRLGVARFPSPSLRDQVLHAASEVWSAPAQPVQHAAAFAFDEPEPLVARVAASRRLHALVATAVFEVFKAAGADVPAPQAAFYLYPALPGRAATDVDLARTLIEDHGVATLPGSAFGDDPAALRLRVATSLLYGDTDDQREQALAADDPAALPWIHDHLSRLAAALGWKL